MSIIMRYSIRATALSCRSILLPTKGGAFAFTHTIASSEPVFGKITFSNGNVYVGEQLVVNTLLPNYLRLPNAEILSSEGASAAVADSTITYTGTHVQGMPQGEGKMVFPNGDTYEGTFVDGMQEGKGMRITKKDTYDGLWRSGMFHGQGVRTFSASQTLQGDFREGRIHTGKGTLVYPNGGRLQAEWRDGTVVGDVRYTFPKCSKYVGGWSDNYMHGYGTLTTRKYTYVGHFEHGVKCGEGKITHADGRTLEGTFKDNKIYNGVGVKVHLSGDTECGTWVNGKLDRDGVRSFGTKQKLPGDLQKVITHTGKDTVVYPNGARLPATMRDVHYKFSNGTTYSGAWTGNTMHGHGTLTKAEYTYVGRFIEGVKCGEGKITYTDGRTLEGTFQNNKIHNGVGTVVHLNGITESGTWVNGKLHGDGVRALSTGQTLQGEFQEGKIFNGRGHYGYPNGAVLRAVWQNGNTVGNVVCTYPDGAHYSGAWLNNKKHGSGVVTNVDGSTLQGDFQYGHIHTGKGTLFCSDGGRLQAEWRDGAIVGYVHYTFNNGDVYTGGWSGNHMHGYGALTHAKYTYVGHFEHGLKCGEGKITHADGRTLEGNFMNDKIYNGVGVKVRANGTSVCGTWVNGKLQGAEQASRV